MSDFAKSWILSRQRFVDEIKDLNDLQLNWKLYPGSLSIGEMALHVAGVEVYFTSQLTGETLSEEARKVARCGTEGVVNDHPFPFSTSEITKDAVAASLDDSKARVEALILEPTPEVLSKEIKSALGPMISGEGAFARIAFHSAYHQGEAYLMKNAPGFPS